MKEDTSLDMYITPQIVRVEDLASTFKIAYTILAVKIQEVIREKALRCGYKYIRDTNLSQIQIYGRYDFQEHFFDMFLLFHKIKSIFTNNSPL